MREMAGDSAGMEVAAHAPNFCKTLNLGITILVGSRHANSIFSVWLLAACRPNVGFASRL